MAEVAASGGTVGTGEFVLHCRGEVRLCCGQADCTPKSKKGRALLAVLAAEQRPLTRIKIIDLLWSDRQEEQARASMRTLLADLREQFGKRFGDLLEVDRERIALAPAVRTDLADPALARFAGELFEGLDHIDPELDEWLRLERGRWANELAAGSLPTSAPIKGRQPVARWPLGLMLLLAIAAAALLYLRPWAAPDQPVVAVLKFKDLTGNNALLADGLAEELRIHLAEHPGVQIIGRESSESAGMQVDHSVAAARAKLRATHVVEGTLLERERVPTVSARLISTRTNEILWADLLRPKGSSLLRGARQIAARIASNVNETVGQGSGRAFEADAEAYASLFKARELNGKWEAKSALQSKIILSGVLQRYPNFAPALALMAESTIRSSDHPKFEGTVPLVLARAQAVQFARRAIRTAPRYGLAYSAMGMALVDTGKDLPYQRRAAELSPGNFEIHRQLARALELAGDMEGSLFHHRRALALEPLNMRMATGVIRALDMTGRRSEIEPLVADFASRTDNRADALRLIQIAAFDTGDISTGYLAGVEATHLDPQDWIAANNRISMDIYLGRRKEALALAEIAGLPESGWLRLLITRDINGLERRMNQAGRDFWFIDWARDDAAELLFASGRGHALLALYDKTRRESMGREPETNFIPGVLITVLEEAGRIQEARRVSRQLSASWTKQARNSGLGRRALYMATLAGLSRDRERAIRGLEIALADHWTNLMLAYVPIEETSAFRWLRGDPRFEAVLSAYGANIDRERRELEAKLKRTPRRNPG